LEDKIGLDVKAPSYQPRRGFFNFSGEGVKAMDMESDMSDGDMGKMKIFRSTYKIHLLPQRSGLKDRSEICFAERIGRRGN
jgi:hypothetical protein